MRKRFAIVFALGLLVAVIPGATTSAQVVGASVTYTTDADFDLGTLVSVNHDPPNSDQLQLDSPTEPFPFINVAASGRGTVVRINTDSGEVVGEYRTAPEGRGLDPSRTTVDLFGSVWTANRSEVDEIGGIPHGSAVKIGLIAGGTRVDGSGTPNPAGEYLAPPFGYSTCSDRDGDGLIRTSSGLFDILDWPDVTDGLGGADGLVEDALDECILIYQRLPDAEQARHVSVDADNNVWVGGFPFDGRMFHKLDGVDGAILDSFDARQFGCGGYGGLVDGHGVLWSIGWGDGAGPLLRYDPATREGMCVDTKGGYGLGVDTNGYLWASIWDNGISKVSPEGVLQPGYPKSTWPTSSTTAGNAQQAFASHDPERLAAMPAVMMQADPGPTSFFQVAPVDDWVQSSGGWVPGSTISLTIEDGGGVVYVDSQVADSSGDFHFGLWDVFDIQRGHVVTVSDGATTKTHTVMDLYVDGIDVDDDTVFGRAGAGTSVDVWVHDGGNLTVTADGSGNWVADFAGITDLTYGSDGGSQQWDDDGDSTGVWWSSPTFQANPDHGWVASMNPWTPNATISLTIEHGGGVVYTDARTANGWGQFHFDMQGAFVLERGHIVTVSDGATTKTHTVIDLYADMVDVSADTVTGRAPADSLVRVWIHGDGTPIEVTADPGGDWIADFSGDADLTPLTEGGAEQSDDDGDSTAVEWSTPRFQVRPEEDGVGSWGRWTPGATISLSIEGGAYTDTATADARGEFWFGLDGAFDIVTGHTVTVTDGHTTKSHAVTSVAVTDIDVGSDTVTGTANPEAWLWVGVGLFEDWSGRFVQADVSGLWVADFSTPWEDQPVLDITEAHFVEVDEFDDDGDVTHRRFGPPTQANRGVAVTPIDNHVWVANSFVGTVTRLDNDGTILKVIPTGEEPTGVAVDAAGSVWVTNLQSDNTVRIDPSSGTDSLGAVDLTVDLGEGAGPYNYSDMTGAVVVGSTSPQGFWTVVQDSGEAGTEWGRLTWNTEPEGHEPAGSEIVVEIRTSDTEAGLGAVPFTTVSNGDVFSSFGRYLEARVTLKASPGGASPILSDIRVQTATIEVPIDVNPTSCPNPFNVDKKGVVPVAILGMGELDVSRIDPATVMLEGISPLRWSSEDVATPYEPYVGRADALDCHELGPDGHMDMTLMFDARAVAGASGDLSDRDVVVLTLTGFTFDGLPIVGEDVVVILTKK